MLLGGYVLEILAGYPRPLYRVIRHPVVLMGAGIQWLDTKLNTPQASPLESRLRGALAMLVLIAVVFFASAVLQSLGWLVEMIAIAMLLATRSLHQHVRAVELGLQQNLEAAREAVSHIVGRDVARLDAHGVARAGIESLAESFCDGVVAPFMAALCFGLPGIAIYKAINTADSMIGHKDARYLQFGWAAARLDDVANFIPARVSGLLLVLASRDRANAWRIMWRDARVHQSPNAGWPEAAMAGALDLKLAGPVVYEGEAHHAPFIGDGRAEATADDMARALSLYRTANLMLMLSVLVLGVLV